VCWLASHEASVLVVRDLSARVVEEKHFRADGVHMRAARALQAPGRAVWFDVEADGDRKLMRLNANGVMYHRHLVARRECACRAGGGA